MSQITLFIGPNRYAIYKERLRWVDECRKRQGEDSVSIYDGKKISWKELHNDCQTAPFLAEKRLIVIDAIPPRGTKDDVKHIEALLHPAALLLFTHVTEDTKKPKLTIPAKELMQIAKIVNFPNMTSAQLQKWLDEQVQESGATSIDAQAKQLLLDTVGNDQELLASEIQKIGMYALGRGIAQGDIEALVSSSVERDVWKLMDYIGAKDTGGALQFVHTLLHRGYSPQALWSTFLWMITQLAQIVAVVETGETNPWKIAGTVRANPYGVKAIMPFARSVPTKRLRYIIQTALEADMGLKTGGYKATSDAPEEILALIDRSILAFAH